jgi:hypothetical protein
MLTKGAVLSAVVASAAAFQPPLRAGARPQVLRALPQPFSACSAGILRRCGTANSTAHVTRRGRGELGTCGWLAGVASPPLSLRLPRSARRFAARCGGPQCASHLPSRFVTARRRRKCSRSGMLDGSAVHAARGRAAHPCAYSWLQPGSQQGRRRGTWPAPLPMRGVKSIPMA